MDKRLAQLTRLSRMEVRLLRAEAALAFRCKSARNSRNEMIAEVAVEGASQRAAGPVLLSSARRPRCIA